MKKQLFQLSIAAILVFVFTIGLAINAAAQDGKCRTLAKDPNNRCLDIHAFEEADFINKIVPLDTATVYYSSSAIAVIDLLGKNAVEDWSTYLVFPKIKKGSTALTLDFEDRDGKKQQVYVTGNRTARILEFFVIEAKGKVYHYALTEGGTKFEKVEPKAGEKSWLQKRKEQATGVVKDGLEKIPKPKKP